MATKQTEQTPIYIPRIDRVVMDVTLVGDTQLVVHAMDEKAKRMIAHLEAKQAKAPRTVRVPEEEARACLHLDADGRPVFPTEAFKASMADAALLVDGVTKSDVRRIVWIHGEHALIEPGDWKMREDVTRLAGPARTPDMRWRPSFFPWRVNLTIETQPVLMPPEAILNLLDWAGAFIGVGEKRPGKSGGDWGRFHVAREGE